MLRFRRIEISNFACFEDLAIELSLDPEKPLTVIRAENGSGKTTLLRAVRWAMYGEKGLPGDFKRFSLHPSSWSPDENGIDTQVAIEFETDGSTRDNASSGTNKIYRLVRSVTTIGKEAARDDRPDFQRIHEDVQLMEREGDGTWSPISSAAETVVDALLPWGLRDFFVMDADEATDFVGGSENKVMSRQAVSEKTTTAVHSLLGLDVFKRASQRVTAIAQGFGKAATKAVGDADLDRLQDDLEAQRQKRNRLDGRVAEENRKLDEITDGLESRRDRLEDELKGVGAEDELRKRLADNRRRSKQAAKERDRDVLPLLCQQLEASNLLATLAVGHVQQAYDVLKPLHDQGLIPLRHLNFVRDLLENGTCVCGEDLSPGSRRRRQVATRVEESTLQEKRANYLGHLHDAARELLAQAKDAGSAWRERRREHGARLAELTDELAEIEQDKREIDKKLDRIDQERIQILRDEIAAFEKQEFTLRSNLSLNGNEIARLKSSIDSLQKQIDQRQRNERAAADKQSAQEMANLVSAVLGEAYRAIQAKQVKELSKRMNLLFAKIVANVTDADFDHVERNKATLRMIAQVGLRALEGKEDRFEIYALNRRGRAMPPIEINGASRRVLALAFVLALCQESGTKAPLVADSLLNFMSGAVRTNTLKATVDYSRQPILLLTGADLEGPAEIAIINKRAGATYTLTGQWDAVEVAAGGDVVRQTKSRPIAILCECGPTQWCDICERVGQSEKPGWSKRTRKGAVA